MSVVKAADIHARIGKSWPAILAQLGIADSFLRPKKAGPCPACSGTDRYIFDNRKGRGDFYCRVCGAGDGFELLRRVYGWPFSEARRQVMHAAGMLDGIAEPRTRPTINTPEPIVSRPPSRVTGIDRTCCPVIESRDAVGYLSARGLWPLPEGCTLRAHTGLDYWDEARKVGRYPGLVATIRDIDGETVTLHVTYLESGAKISSYEPRKLLSKLEGREGCAVRLMPATDVLAIAEGIETALSAATLLKIPAWAALNTSLLARFEPPPDVTRLVICADRDGAGLTAAGRLMERLQGRIRFELQVPKAPAKDFNDQLTGAKRHTGAHHV